MTAPVPLDELVAAGHALAARLGRLPSGRELRRHLRIGHPRSAEVLAAIAPEPVAEPVEVSQVETPTGSFESVAGAPVPQVEPAAEPVATAVPGEASAAPAAPVRSSTRLLVWASLLAGVAASVGANIAHAAPGLGPHLTSGFAPCSLLLAIAVLERAPRHRNLAVAVLSVLGLVAVAVVAAVVSYSHQYALLIGYGETRLDAALLPVAVDGLIAVASLALLAMRDRRAG